MLFTALQLTLGEFPSLEPGHRLSFACPVLDDLLHGGLPLHGITELAGESAAGKTQFGLQLSLSVQYPREHGGLGAGKAGIGQLSLKINCSVYLVFHGAE